MTEKIVDQIIEARWVIPVLPRGQVLEHAAVVVNHGRIEAILPTADVRSNFKAENTTVLAEHALIPGLVNLHTHAAMSLMRGLADDLPLMSWLADHVWPAEASAPSMIRCCVLINWRRFWCRIMIVIPR